MKVNDIRQKFLDFFESKQHKIVPAAPIVNQNDPTLMFINSGMAQFKDFFLGNQPPSAPRIADTQKCLRVSGKHNDLEDVGRDGYHLTLFEMLGNWSFGDYFKKEAIAWSWELLTEVYQIPKDRLYVTVFGGDTADNLPADEEAVSIWKQYIAEDRIAYFSRKDNFWEMGDTGPCGPCTEIHVDIRSDEARAQVDGRELVNMDHPQVIEIWNNVFMEFERRADGSLIALPKKHVDTGMGLERLCMVLQNKESSYDTDVFTPYIQFLEENSGKKYGGSYAPEAKSDMAMRVVADHIRAISMVIADGQLPSNTGAGYVVRRILRRALRYAFSFLDIQEPILYRLLPIVAERFQDVFPEVKAQEAFIAQVIKSEEEAFLRTLSNGLKRLEDTLQAGQGIDGQTAFELYDTYGFPYDLTALLASERGLSIDEAGFKAALEAQKERSRKDAEKEMSDWVELLPSEETRFLGYDQDQAQARLLRYREVKAKGKAAYQLVLDQTPFYPEGGGQVGDTGTLQFGEENIEVTDTKKENNLIVHWTAKLPQRLDAPVFAQIDAEKRRLTENNHSATHLLHAALRQILGEHVQQKGSLVKAEALRFDFSHFQKLSAEELQAVESLVNAKIRENASLVEARNLPLAQAQAAGAMMLFGEKYGEQVRMITLGQSKELCGGCHVKATGQIGYFKIVEETSIASGVRRITAYTAQAAENYVNEGLALLQNVREQMKSPKDLMRSLQDLQEQYKQVQKQVEQLELAKAMALKTELLNQTENMGNFERLIAKVDLSQEALKELCSQLNHEHPRLVLALGRVEGDKPSLTVAMTKELSDEKGFHAGKIVKEAAKHMQGGGGGQAFFATAGGSLAQGLEAALNSLKDVLK